MSMLKILTLRVMVRVVKNQVNVAIDTTGENLSQRGYRREEAGEAPLREHLAAGLVEMTGWKGDMQFDRPHVWFWHAVN
jgi:putative N6-adenine-specific DNA methylase